MRTPAGHDAAIAVLESRLRATAILNWVMAASGLAVGLVLATVTVGTAKTSTYGQVAFVFVMTLGAFAMTWVMVQTARALHPIRGSIPYRALTEDATALAWAYFVLGRSSGIKLHFIDGDMFHVHTNRTDGALLLELVRARAPHAILGYGAEQQRLYTERVRTHTASRAG